MNAKDLTFGIEIETVAPYTAVASEGLRIGGYHHGIQVPYLPTGWKAEADSSIETAMIGGYPCEIVSPILRGEEGILQVIGVLQTLNSKGHRVNMSCGFHVHIGWPTNATAKQLARLITIVAYLERGLYAITGTKTREKGRPGHLCYAKGVRRLGNDENAKRFLDHDRYHALNLTNLARGTRPTVEFRVFSGTTNATKAVGWIQVCLGIVERALNGKRNATWEPKALQGGWKKAGPGQSETERLIGYLAWGEGYARIHGGNQYGWISNIIPQDAVKAEFRRLAKKYDSEA